MPRKNKKYDDLDTETTFVDMNVEGFSWYDPSKKSGARAPRKVTKKEYRQMVKGAFAALAPFLVAFVVAFGLVVLFAYLWLR